MYTSKCVHGAWRGGGVLHFVLVECVGDSIHNHSHHEPQTGGDEAINTASFKTSSDETQPITTAFDMTLSKLVW